MPQESVQQELGKEQADRMVVFHSRTISRSHREHIWDVRPDLQRLRIQPVRPLLFTGLPVLVSSAVYDQAEAPRFRQRRSPQGPTPHQKTSNM